MKPIIFSRNISKIQTGEKTQTRRVMSPQPAYQEFGYEGRSWCYHDDFAKHPTDFTHLCPYGQPGALLWVRESWRVADGKEYTLIDPEWAGGKNPAHIEYKANDPHPENVMWRSPIFMPKWASRITLKITDIRIERIQDLSESDCFSEMGLPIEKRRIINVFADFQKLWDKINAKRGFPWQSNPWVWRLSFKLQE